MDWRTRGEESPSRENREHSRYFDCLREVCAFTCSAHATPFPHSSIHVVAQDWKHGARKSFRFYAITRATWAIRYEKEGGEINNGGKNRAWKLNRALRSKLSNNYFKSLLFLIKSIFSLLLPSFFFFVFSSLFFCFSRNISTLSLPLSRNHVKHFLVEKGFAIENPSRIVVDKSVEKPNEGK